MQQYAALLAEATATVADPAVRHRGTFGGALAHADPAGDLAAVALALDAELVAEGPGGRRTIAARDFFVDYLETALSPDEILAAVRVPKLEGDWGCRYEKFNRVAQAWAIVGVAAAVRMEGGAIAEARIGLTNMGSTPVRPARGRGRARRGVRPRGGHRGGASAAEGTTPPSDLGAQADYRAHLARVLTARAVAHAAGLIADPTAPGARRGLLPEGVDDPAGLARRLADAGYFADEGVATAAYLALALPRPLFLEGEAGVGKTALAHALAQVVGAELLRLQCYEGIDASQALYDWDFPRQLLHLRAAESAGAAPADADRLEAEVYSRRFLLARPLLAALETTPAVLLVDEVDRADDEFEAFLLEVLSDYTVTVPELGTVRAEVPPVVVVTSNRTREVHDALKRRCLYHWVEHPRFEREVEIVRRARAGGVGAAGRAGRARRRRCCAARTCSSRPASPRRIDWTAALVALGAERLDADPAAATLGAVLKYREDQLHARRLDVQPMIATAVARWLTARRAAVRRGRQPRRAGRHAARRRACAPRPTGCTRPSQALAVLDPVRRDDVYWAGRLTLCGSPDDLARYDTAFAAYFGDRPGPVVRRQRLTRTQLQLVAEPGDGGSGEDDGEQARAARRRREHRRAAAPPRRHAARRRRAGAAAPAARRAAPAGGAPRRPAGCGPSAARPGRRRPHAARVARRRRRAGPAAPPRAVAPARAGSCCSSTSAARWRATPTRCCASRTPPPAARSGADRGLRARHPADPDHPRDGAARPGRRDGRGRRRARRRRRRHPARRAAEAVPRPWGQRGTARGAVVVVLSDGWERGDAALLGEQMAPPAPAGAPGGLGQPAQGRARLRAAGRRMAAALPHVDDFVEGHSLAALEHLAAVVLGRDAAPAGAVAVRDIADGLRDLLAAGPPFALATVIGARGSSPRPPGAAMAVAPTARRRQHLRRLRRGRGLRHRRAGARRRRRASSRPTATATTTPSPSG